MSLRTTIEIHLAVASGVDLAWLDRVAPDVAISWRREHYAEVTKAFHAVLAARPV